MDKSLSQLTDANTHSIWNLNGYCISGPFKITSWKRWRHTRNSGIAGNNFIRILRNINCRIWHTYELNNRLPGITGLLENRVDTAAPIRELSQIILRGENTLTEMERELVATIVSYKNQCRYCTNAHAATVIALGGHKRIAGKSIS